MKRRDGASLVLLALLAVLSVSRPLLAQTIYWDTNGATVGTGNTSSGTWVAIGGSALWTTDPTGSIATSDYATAGGATPLTTADVVFAAGTNATAGNITISGAVEVRSITFQETLAFSAPNSTPSLTIGNGGLTIDSTVGGNISWNSGLPVILGANQSWANNSNSLLTLGSAITGNAASGTRTLELNGSGSGGMTFSQNFSDGAGGGNLAVNINTTGGGATILGGTSAYSGGLTITQGIVRANGSSSSNSVLNMNGGLLTLAGGELRLIRSASTGGTTFTGSNTQVTGSAQITAEVGSGSAGATHTLGTLAIGEHVLTVTTGASVDSGNGGVTFGATSITDDATFNVVDGATNTARLNLGALSGTSSITKTGTGTLNLSTTAAAFSGGLNIDEGIVILGTVGALGSGEGTVNLGKAASALNATLNLTAFNVYAASPMNVNSGSGTRTLLASGNTSGNTDMTYSGLITLANNLSIVNSATHSGNSGFEISGGITGTGNVTLNNTNATGGVPFVISNQLNNDGTVSNISTGGNTVTISAAIGGAVDAIIQDSSTASLIVSGSNPDFAGILEVRQGTLTVTSLAGLNAANTLYVAEGATFSRGSASGTMVIAGINDYDGGGGIVTRNTTAASRPLELAGIGSYSFSGVMQDAVSATNPFSLIKSGSGTQVLSGVSTYTGSTTVSGGVLIIASGGALTATSAVTVNGGTLGGGGSIASAVTINSTGTLAPGSSPGILSVNNNVTFNTGSTFSVELSGTTVGTGYDQLIVGGIGILSLNGTNNLELTLNGGFFSQAQAGDVFTIALVQGTDSANTLGVFEQLNGVTTTLTQGSSFALGDAEFTISYRAEDTTFDMDAGLGNNVMLQLVAIPEPGSMALGALALAAAALLRRCRT